MYHFPFGTPKLASLQLWLHCWKSLNFFIQMFFCVCVCICACVVIFLVFGLSYRIQEEMDRLSRQNVQADNRANQEMVSCFLFFRKIISHEKKKKVHKHTEDLLRKRVIKNSKLLASLLCCSYNQSSIVVQRLTSSRSVSLCCFFSDVSKIEKCVSYRLLLLLTYSTHLQESQQLI